MSVSRNMWHVSPTARCFFHPQLSRCPGEAAKNWSPLRLLHPISRYAEKKNMVGHVGCRNLMYHAILPPPVVDRRRWASALKSNRSSSCYPCVSDMSAIFSHNHNFPCMFPFKFPLTIEQIHRHPYISYQTGYHIVFPLFTPVSKWNP